MSQIKPLNRSASQLQREIRIAQIVRLHPTPQLRDELRRLLETLEVSESGSGQLIVSFSQFGVGWLEWQMPKEEFTIDSGVRGRV